MEKEAINKAIATAIGNKWHQPSEAELASGSYYQYAPDFTSDLNAMHEAEKVRLNGMMVTYALTLSAILGPKENVITATAVQRSEAFLRTLGLWQEQPQEQPA